MRLSVTDLLESYKNDQGWSDSDLVVFLSEYVEGRHEEDELKAYLDCLALCGGTRRNAAVEKKLEALAYCVRSAHVEDAMSHLFDLLYFLRPHIIAGWRDSQAGMFQAQRFDYGTSGYFAMLHRIYGENPHVLGELNAEQENEEGSGS